ncbi:hypothetical protein BC828DRAFT_379441 [Blastocladiella britannica]|nr:hypothetical protein BC828DRAFT_379441 [Blastocladiella britannica]
MPPPSAKNPPSDDAVLAVSRRMLAIGVPALPLMWLVHIFYTWPLAHAPHHARIAPTLRRHMTWAGAGVLVYFVAFVSWWAVFATHRVSMGPLGDSLVVVDVKGT